MEAQYELEPREPKAQAKWLKERCKQLYEKHLLAIRKGSKSTYVDNVTEPGEVTATSILQNFFCQIEIQRGPKLGTQINVECNNLKKNSVKITIRPLIAVLRTMTLKCTLILMFVFVGIGMLDLFVMGFGESILGRNLYKFEQRKAIIILLTIGTISGLIIGTILSKILQLWIVSPSDKKSNDMQAAQIHDIIKANFMH